MTTFIDGATLPRSTLLSQFREIPALAAIDWADRDWRNLSLRMAWPIWVTSIAMPGS